MKRTALSRRTVLRGLGVAVGLPFLDAMQPAFADPIRESPRLGIVYAPNGMYMPAWTPPGDAGPVSLSTTLEPLRAIHGRYTAISGVSMDTGDEPDAAAGPHSLACTGFLTGAPPLRSEGALRASVSIDQKAARASEQGTWLPSIELACEPHQVSWGDREPGYSTAYLNHLSWRTPTMPMPAETDPKSAFDRLFRDGGRVWSANRRAKSVLDRVNPDARSLASKLGPADQSRLDDYLSNLRELEQRVQTSFDLSKRDLALLMMDIVALAFQTSTTRVATVMLGREKSHCTFPELNIPETHHQLSHRYRDEKTIQKLCAIDLYHTELFAHLVQRLDSMKTAEGSVLDSSILVYGSGLSDGNHHRHDNLPILIAGGCYVPARQDRPGNSRKLTDLHGSIIRSFGHLGRN